MEIDYRSKDSHKHIKERCKEASEFRQDIISPDNETNLVVRLTPTLVVKYGPGVMRAEACALEFATKNLNHDIVKVPSFVQFFTSQVGGSLIGYLVMAFVEGTTLDRSAEIPATLVRKILDAMSHIHSFTRAVPGPLDGGPARGLLWSEDGTGQILDTPTKLQEYIDIRIRRGNHSLVDFTNSTLCLCHMDIAPRNIIVDSRGVICLLDWGCAGFYPSSFETWSIVFEAHLRYHPLAAQLASLSPWMQRHQSNAARLPHSTKFSLRTNALHCTDGHLCRKNFRTNACHSHHPGRQEETYSIMRAALNQGSSCS